MNLYREAFLNIKKFPKTFWVVVLATLINQIGNMAFVFLMLYVTQYLGFSLSEGAVAFAVLCGSMFLTGFFAGGLIDFFGASRVTILSVMINGVVLLIFPAVHDYFLLLGFCVLWGVSYGIYRPASQTLVSFLSAEGLHKITFSVYRLAINLGMSIGPAIGGYLALYSFKLNFIMNGVANLLAGTILILGLGTVVQASANKEKKKGLAFKILVEDKVFLWFLLGMVPVAMIFFQHESTLPIYLKNNLGLPTSFYGWLFTINTLMIVCLELSLNVATLNWPYRVNFVLGSFFIAAGFAGIYFASTMWHIVLVTVIWTIGEMVLFPSTSSYVAEVAPPERRGSYMSLYNASTNLGMLIGPWTGAIIMQYWGGSTLWMTCGVWGLISILIFSICVERKSKI